MSVQDERFEALLGAAAPLVVSVFDALPDAIGVVWPTFDAAGALVDFEVAEETAAGLRRISRETGATMFMTVLAAFSVLLIGIGVGVLFFLNKKFRWWASADLLAAETRRADAAKADATQQVAAITAAMERRIQEMRDDGAARVIQVRADSQAELDRLLKVVDAVQREVESWRQAFHLADQANREEDDARWDRIEAAMAVLKTFVLGVQRAGVVDLASRELEARGDGRRSTDVVR
jgi:hypothetical protein